MQISDSTESLEAWDTRRTRGVNLNFVWDRIWPYKWVVVIVIFLFEVIVVLYSLVVPSVYEVKTVLLPKRVDNPSVLNAAATHSTNLKAWFLEQSDLHIWGQDSKAVVLLRSRAFTERFIVKNHLLPVLLMEGETNRLRIWPFSRDNNPTMSKAYRKFDRNIRSVTEDLESGVVTLSIRWHDRFQAVTWAQNLVDDVNEEMRIRDIKHSKAIIGNLENTLKLATDSEAQKILRTMLAVELSHYILAKSRDDYGFSILTPPELPSKSEYIWPRKGFLALGALVLGLIVGVVLAFILGLFRPTKES